MSDDGDFASVDDVSYKLEDCDERLLQDTLLCYCQPKGKVSNPSNFRVLLAAACCAFFFLLPRPTPTTMLLILNTE